VKGRSCKVDNRGTMLHTFVSWEAAKHDTICTHQRAPLRRPALRPICNLRKNSEGNLAGSSLFIQLCRTVLLCPSCFALRRGGRPSEAGRCRSGGPRESVAGATQSDSPDLHGGRARAVGVRAASKNEAFDVGATGDHLALGATISGTANRYRATSPGVVIGGGEMVWRGGETNRRPGATM
jgi:hypothetical protein